MNFHITCAVLIGQNLVTLVDDPNHRHRSARTSAVEHGA